MKVIYARVSTDSQTNDNQITDLKARFPDASVVTETVSGVKKKPKLEELIGKLDRGSTLIVAALDRLGRRTSEVLALIESLEAKGIILVSVREGVDYSTIAGRLVTQVLCSVAEMERRIISERTKLGLAHRKALGIKLGRAPKFNPELIQQVKSMRAEGITLQKISESTGVSVSRIHQLTKIAA